MFKMNYVISGLLGLMSLCIYTAHPQNVVRESASLQMGNFTGAIAKNSKELIEITTSTIHNQWKRLEKLACETKADMESVKAEYLSSLTTHTKNKTSLEWQFTTEYIALRNREPLTQEEIDDFKDAYLLVEVGFPKDPQALKEAILGTQAQLVWQTIVAFLAPIPEDRGCTIA